jgi:S-adenosylmethionine decarboxylase proenzyme
MVEFYDCDQVVINDREYIQVSMEEAARQCGATVVQTVFHTFNPHGISGVVVIAESHLAIHTWPEYGYCAVDLFTCGDDINPELAFTYLQKALRAGSFTVVEMRRGLIKLNEGELVHKPVSSC